MAPDERVSEQLVHGMVSMLEHRGPDDRGCKSLPGIALGQRRLSILDATPRGNQPMVSEDGRYWLVHNGEIYNFLELRDELVTRGHVLRTGTDTEVILAAYSEWGTDCYRRFNGIWAFALWDTERRRLILARDRFGIKPLYFARSGSTFAFASEIKALLALPGVPADPEPGAVRDYLADGIVDHSDQTFYRAISRVPAAHVIEVGPQGELSRTRYWGPPDLTGEASFRSQPADAEFVEELRELLIDAVALQLRSDVPMGMCLSGGVDSSSITCIATALRDGQLPRGRLGHAERDAAPHFAFFAEFRDAGIDERPHVDAVVEKTGIDLRVTAPDADAFVDALEPVVAHQDEPFVSASVVAQYHVMQLAREAGVKVVLDGQGADEILAGYMPFIGPRLGGAVRALQLGGVATHLRRRPQLLPTTVRYALLGPRRRAGWMGGRSHPGWLGPGLSRSDTLWSQPERVEGTVLAQALWYQITTAGLASLLRYLDRNSMASGIEARVPFLDHRLVELSLRMPDRLKVHDGRRKVALLRAMTGIVPDSILQRRDKVAFAPPQGRWLSEASDRLRWLGANARSEEAGFVRPGAIGDALGAARADATGTHADLWRMINLELWLRRGGTGAAVGSS